MKRNASVFDTVLKNIQRMDPGFKPINLDVAAAELHKKVPYSKEIKPFEFRTTKVMVEMLRPIPHPTVYNRDGSVSKRQPKLFPIQEGVWLSNWGHAYRLKTKSNINIMENPIEGIDFKFI